MPDQAPVCDDCGQHHHGWDCPDGGTAWGRVGMAVDDDVEAAAKAWSRDPLLFARSHGYEPPDAGDDLTIDGDEVLRSSERIFGWPHEGWDASEWKANDDA